MLEFTGHAFEWWIINFTFKVDLSKFEPKKSLQWVTLKTFFYSIFRFLPEIVFYFVLSVAAAFAGAVFASVGVGKLGT
jgi:hypothetical protein